MNVFPAYANPIFWLAIGAAGATLVGVPAALIAWARTPYATGKHEPGEQPIKFDHRHHVRDDGIPCEYCHGGALHSKLAGVPPTSLCMGCHSQIWTSSPELSELRRSFFANEPIHWQRISTLPDFVFFDHSAHVTHGVGCVTCHGRVDRMGQVYAEHPLTIKWCLDCHAHPERFLRPLEKVTDMEWQPDRPQEELGRELRARLGVRSIVTCTACHR